MGEGNVVRLQEVERDSIWRVRHDLVDVAARLDHGDPLGEGHDRSTLVRLDHLVGQHADDQPIPARPSGPQECHVPGMKEVADHVHVHPHGLAVRLR
jgi:hypothetical protein